MRAKEWDLLRLQIKSPEDDYSYPIPREVDDLWSVPSDGDSYWNYYGFEHYYHEQTRPCWYWWGGSRDILVRKLA
ncbi:MAG: hypothetical protein FWC97_01740 [Treponema sp.]|nr:hypothetical protein [Treponema sp.]